MSVSPETTARSRWRLLRGSPPRPKMVEGRGAAEFPADLGRGDVRIPQGRVQGRVPEHLADELQVAGLPEDARGRVVAQRVGPDLARETRPPGQAVEDVARRGAAQRPPLPVGEQVVLGARAWSHGEPRAQEGGGLGPEEAGAVLLPFPSVDGERPLTEPHVFDAEPECLADAQAAVGEER